MKLKEKMRKGKDGGQGPRKRRRVSIRSPKARNKAKRKEEGQDRQTHRDEDQRAGRDDRKERERGGRGRRAEDTLSERVSKNATRSVQARGSQPKGETDEAGEWG